MKLKYKYVKNNAFCKDLEFIDKGDMVDLYLPDNVEFKQNESKMLNLDVVFDIPNGYLMKIYPRSSTYNKYKVLLTNSVGIIDSTYKGDNDTIKAVLFATNPTSINAGTRILQFELVLSQKATLWQKIKWFFSSSVKLERVPNFVSFTDKNRGGYGSTGI